MPWGSQKRGAGGETVRIISVERLYPNSVTLGKLFNHSVLINLYILWLISQRCYKRNAKILCKGGSSIQMSTCSWQGKHFFPKLDVKFQHPSIFHTWWTGALKHTVAKQFAYIWSLLGPRSLENWAKIARCFKKKILDISKNTFLEFPSWRSG